MNYTLVTGALITFAIIYFLLMLAAVAQFPFICVSYIGAL